MGTPFNPRLENSASYMSFLSFNFTPILSMTVYLPSSLTFDFTFSASSGRTKLSDKIFLTICTPSFILFSSSVAQYIPSKYSSTYTGTFAPSLIFFVKSLRTTFPAKCAFNFIFKSSISTQPHISFRNQNHL
ncbi:Uncharacterised protein [Streptococcus pneumoniae]|nr:Uncharacterised protein [Streptococcus pneumoniae]CKG26177.1 Uncharacterised protein [Streptococcus pneumoniae]